MAPKCVKVRAVCGVETVAGDKQHELLEEVDQFARAGLWHGFPPGGLHAVVAIQPMPNTLEHDKKLKPCDTLVVLADELPLERGEEIANDIEVALLAAEFNVCLVAWV